MVIAPINFVGKGINKPLLYFKQQKAIQPATQPPQSTSARGVGKGPWSLLALMSPGHHVNRNVNLAKLGVAQSLRASHHFVTKIWCGDDFKMVQ